MVHEQQLRDLMTPQACYSPESIRAFLRYSRKQSDDNIHNVLPRTGSCGEYISQTLFPEWLARDTLITYCHDVSELKKEPRVDPTHPAPDETTRPDPRFDPYGARDWNVQPTEREELVRRWIATEKSIEDITRRASVQHLARKCGSFSTNSQSYLDAYADWFSHR